MSEDLIKYSALLGNRKLNLCITTIIQSANNLAAVHKNPADTNRKFCVMFTSNIGENVISAALTAT